MNKIPSKGIMAVIFIILVLTAILFLIIHKSHRKATMVSDQQQVESESTEESIRDDIRRSDQAINLYGKVIDQSGQPIPGAIVEVHIQHYSPDPAEDYMAIKKILIKSNADGSFEVKKQKGNGVLIHDIRKPGYDLFSYADNEPNSFDLTLENVSLPKKTNPVICRLRKKGAPTYLIEWENDTATMFGAGATDEVWYLDLVWPDFRPAHQTNLNVDYGSQPMYTDAMMLVQSNQDHTAYNICFVAPDASGGILETNVLMHTAPESGYQTNWVYSMPIIINKMYTTNVYFYIKSRGGKVYARMNAEITSYDEKNYSGVLVNFHSWANPYGERNLEAEPRLKYDTQQRLHDEAQAALLAGKLPPQPDIPKLLKTEGEYKE